MGSQKTRQSQPYLAFMRDPVLVRNDVKRSGAMPYLIKDATRWEDLGPAVKLLKTEDMDFRLYQFSIAETVYIGENVFAATPTGSGKTFLGLLAAANAISKGKKALFAAAMVPLVKQHYDDATKRFRDTEGISMLVRSVGRGKRKEIYEKAKLIIGTPQIPVKAINDGEINLDDFGVLILDEAQRARKKYDYVPLARMFIERGIQVVSLTATLSSKKSTAASIIMNLDPKHVEVRDYKKDRDIMPFEKEVTLSKVEVEKSPTMLEIETAFKRLIGHNLDHVIKAGLLGREDEDTSFNFGALREKQIDEFIRMPRLEFLALQKDANLLRDDLDTLMPIARNNRLMHKKADDALEDEISTKVNGVKGFTKLKYIIHAYDTFETQGFTPVLDYVEKLYANHRKDKHYSSKSLGELLKGTNDPPYEKENTLHEVYDPIAAAVRAGQEHPKVEALMDIVSNNPKDKIMIFANDRATVNMLVGKLKNRGLDARPFIGQKGGGMTQTMQRKTMDDFSDSKFNIIVSTCIGEEGMDFKGAEPSLVICYDAVPSGIRTRQRHGRTGRHMPGRVIALVTKGTREEMFYQIAQWRMANIDKINDMLRNGEIGSLVRQVERPKKPPVRHDNKVKDQIPTLTGTQLSLIGIRQHIDVG